MVKILSSKNVPVQRVTLKEICENAFKKMGNSGKPHPDTLCVFALVGVVKNFHPIDPVIGFNDNIHFPGKGSSGETESIAELSSDQHLCVGEK